MPTPSTGTGPGFDSPLPPGGASVAGAIDVTQITDPATRSLIQSLSTEIKGYDDQITQLGQNYKTAQDALAGMDPSDPGYAQAARNADSLATAWASAMNNKARASDTRAQTIQKAIDNRWLQQGQQDLWAATAEKDRADAQSALQNAQTAQQKAGPERDLLIAQASSTNAQAALASAQAGSLNARTPAEVQQLQAQAGLLAQQANETAARAQLTGAEAQKAQAEAGVAPRAAEATTQTLEAQAGQQQRTLQNMPTPEQAGALTQNQIGQGQANIGATQAGAMATQAQTGKAILGQTFGLAQQIEAIKNIADQMRTGQIPLGTDPQNAIDNMNTMLQQYLQATLGGTTVADASKQAADAVQKQFESNVTQRQQDASLQGQGMSGAAGMFNSAISPFVSAVRDLPAGSRALGPVVEALAAPFYQAAQGKLVTPPPQVPTPALPPFLAGFAGQQPAQQGHQITINIGGAGTNAPAQDTTGQPSMANAPAPAAAPTSLPPEFAQSGLSEGSSRGNLPAFMSGAEIATPAHVNNLWANDPFLSRAGVGA